MLLLFGFLLLLTIAETNTGNSKAVTDSPEKQQQHKEHYHINNFNQLADDDRTEQHTEDFSDYVNEEHADYVEPEYDEDYYNKEDDENNEKPGQVDSSKAAGQGVTQKELNAKENGDGSANNTGLKWFNKKPDNQTSPNHTPQQYNVQTKPNSNSLVSKVPSSNVPLSNIPNSNVLLSNNLLPNEAQIKNDSNILSRIKNIKENANRLSNEKIIYADERFLLLKFKLTPLNDSSVQTVLNDEGEDIDGLERKSQDGKSKDSSLFDSSFFDDDSFFDEFDDSKEESPILRQPVVPISNYERASHSRVPQQNEQYNNNKNGDNILHHTLNHNSKYVQGNNYPNKYYKTGKGFWIGNNYYPYHGPGFSGHGPRRPYYHSDEDFSDEDSSDSSDCSEEYEDSDEDDGKDTGILYGKPRPGIGGNRPTNGRDPGILYGNQGPGIVVISTNGGVPPNGRVPTNGGVPTNGNNPTDDRDTGILYGNPQPGVVNTPGTGVAGNNPGNNTDVVLVLVSAQ